MPNIEWVQNSYSRQKLISVKGEQITILMSFNYAKNLSGRNRKKSFRIFFKYHIRNL